MEITATMNLSELAERMGDYYTEAHAHIMREMLTRYYLGSDTADIDEGQWDEMLCSIYIVDGPRGELAVEATSKADAVNVYASEHGYRTVGSPDFTHGGDVWFDVADGDVKYTVQD